MRPESAALLRHPPSSARYATAVAAGWSPWMSTPRPRNSCAPAAPPHRAARADALLHQWGMQLPFEYHSPQKSAPQSLSHRPRRGSRSPWVRLCARCQPCISPASAQRVRCFRVSGATAPVGVLLSDGQSLLLSSRLAHELAPEGSWKGSWVGGLATALCAVRGVYI